VVRPLSFGSAGDSALLHGRKLRPSRPWFHGLEKGMATGTTSVPNRGPTWSGRQSKEGFRKGWELPFLKEASVISRAGAKIPDGMGRSGELRRRKKTMTLQSGGTYSNLRGRSSPGPTRKDGQRAGVKGSPTIFFAKKRERDPPCWFRLGACPDVTHQVLLLRRSSGRALRARKSMKSADGSISAAPVWVHVVPCRRRGPKNKSSAACG